MRGPFTFVPPAVLGDRPHLVVDGAPRPGTVATISHWPGTPTPGALIADLSAESAVLALAAPRALPRGIRTVTVDHADEDGVVALGLLCVDGLAGAHGDLLVEAARVGDFGVVGDRRAALVAFTLAALLDPARTPVEEVRSGVVGGMGAVGVLARHGVDCLPDVAKDVEAFEGLWAAEATAYDAAVAALSGGVVRLTEEPERDLAVVEATSGTWPPAAAWAGHPLHPAAVNSATRCMRVATVSPGDCRLLLRYETWVRLARPQAPLRVDLSVVAAELDRREGYVGGSAGGSRGAFGGSSGGTGGDGCQEPVSRGAEALGRHGAAGDRAVLSWRFDGAGALTPRLHHVGTGASRIGPDEFLEVVRDGLDRLDQGAPAWDPYR
ncbi:MAG: hypothetical protein M0013_09900 [Actinomycetota bacterium]|nr:hypothetical protein [Actinomycetota bacterium]